MKNKNITYIICAAGAGSRLKDISAVVPKPLLLLNNKTLLERSLDSLTVQKGDQVIVVHRFDALNEDFQKALSQKLGYQIIFFKISELTSGQAETAALTKNLIVHNQIAIFNKDRDSSNQDEDEWELSESPFLLKTLISKLLEILIDFKKFFEKDANFSSALS
jgi:dTDP-glucose pyrophosphorylase